MKLQGKVALVTGGAQGIGRAIATRLAQEGAAVIIEDLSDNARAEETLQELQAMGARTALLTGDVGKVADGQRVIREGVAAMGRIDILVNNAGVERRAGFFDASESD
jgi:glucose 1-dehydrogenase